MSLPSRPFDNKKHYDSGRMRHVISFMQYVVGGDGSGGTSSTEPVLLYQTKAGKENVSTYKQAQIIEGFQNYQEVIYFIIRKRKQPLHYPTKNMMINYGVKSYTIIEVTELDDPCTFIRILAANNS